MPGTWLDTTDTTTAMSSSVAGFPVPDTAGDLAQTFYIDPLSVLNSRYTFITEIDLYFYGKPNYNGVLSSSGIPKPGVTITLVDTKTQNGIQVPDLDKPIRYGQVRKEWDDINIDTTGATATTFKFPNVPLETDYSYGIIIKFDGFDTGYQLWRNKSGETYNNVTSPNVSKGALDGFFFTLTNGVNLNTQTDVDLKFNVRVAKFTTTPTTVKIVNRDIEKLIYRSSSLAGTFIGGEPVYANTGAISAQTVAIVAGSNTITGTSTKFTSNFSTNNYIVIKNGTSSYVRQITNISNNTLMTVTPAMPASNSSSQYLITAVGIVHNHRPFSNSLVIAASSANTTYNFTPNTTCNTVIGAYSGAKVTVTNLENVRVDEFNADFNIFLPPGTSANTNVKLANSTFNTVNTLVPVASSASGSKKKLVGNPAFLYSRTDEVTQGNGSVGTLTGQKSMNFEISLKTDNPFCSPHIDEENLVFNAYSRYVSNDLTNENLNNGSATSKYVTRTVTLAEGHDSEDMIVYATAYRPYGTDVVVYAKFYNPSDPETIQSKNWTRLEQTTTSNLYSNKDNIRDLVEIRYTVPKLPVYDWNTKATGNVVQGKFTGLNACNVITSSVAQVNNMTANGVAPGDLVRVYNPLYPNNSLITVATASNTTTITIDTTLLTSNTRLTEFVTNGLVVERIKNKNVAFSNYTANGVLRYYNSSMAAYDTYKAFALKIVFTGASGSGTYPFLDDIRGIAVSI